MGIIGKFVYNFFDRWIDRLDRFDQKYEELRLKRETRKLESRKRRSEIKKLKIQYSPIHERLSKLATHKVIMYGIFINCTVVEIYSMRAMIRFADLSALPTLMAAVITESISYAIYCAKSYNGTKQEKIQELDEKKFELEKEIAQYQIENNLMNDNLNNNSDIDDSDCVG